MTHFIEILNISSQLPLHKWDCLNAYFSDFKVLHAHSIVWKAQNVQRIPLTEWLPGLCFWAAFMHGLFHCFMLHRGLLALNIASFSSVLSLRFFQNHNSWNSNLFVFLFNNPHNSACIPQNSSFIPTLFEYSSLVLGCCFLPLYSFSHMKGPFLSLCISHTYRIMYNVQLYFSENEYSEVFILYFVCLYFELSAI